MERSSLVDVAHSVWRSRAARIALIGALGSAATYFGTLSRWALSDPWRADPTLGAVVSNARDAKSIADKLETNRPLYDRAIWKELTILRYRAACKDKSASGLEACETAAAHNFDWYYRDAKETLDPVTSKGENAEEESLRLIQAPLPSGMP